MGDVKTVRFWISLSLNIKKIPHGIFKKQDFANFEDGQIRDYRFLYEHDRQWNPVYYSKYLSNGLVWKHDGALGR